MKKIIKALKEKVASKKGKIILGVFSIVLVSFIAVVVTAHKNITIDLDGEKIEVATFKGNVQAVLSQKEIYLSDKDKIEPSLTSGISDNDVIKIKKAVPVEVMVDGKNIKIDSAEDSVEKMLVEEGIDLNELDKVEPSLETELSKDLKIQVTRVEEKTIVEKEPIEFETVVKEDDSLESGVNKTTQEGSAGEKEITMKLVMEDGKEVSREVVESKVVKEPVDEVVVKGTMEKLVLSRGNDNIDYKKMMVVEATAYAGDGITATGTVPKRDPSGLSTIAVDPRVIPLGTKVYIEGYGYAVAEDTGGAIKNNIIDLFLNSSAECKQWGRRNVNLYIIAYPGEW
ncbi:DUF348 domain-containing protein [Clostridium perfringens]|nr:DUF348 domain-containing protein [Clostridium perfringens]